MKRLFVAFSLVAMAMMGVVATPDEGSAVPSFARQTGNACVACHFQYFPKLNAYGRAFKMGGFTETAVDLIEDDNMSLPVLDRVSIVFKIRYNQNTPEGGDSVGSWDMPDEDVMLFGGRVSENIGTLVEFAGGASAEYKAVFLIVKGDINAGVIPWWGSGVGVGSNDPLSGGFNKTGRPFENRDYWTAYGHTAFEEEGYGVNLFANSDLFHVAAGMWAPKDLTDAGFDLAMQYRATFMPAVGDWNLGIGVGGVTGEVTVAGDDGDEVTEFDTIGVDFQAQGELGNGMTIQVDASYLTAGGEPAEPGFERNNMAGSVTVGFTPQFVAAAGYGIRGETKDGTDYEVTAINLMGMYKPAQNVSIRYEHSILDGDLNEVSRIKGLESKGQLMLFYGF